MRLTPVVCAALVLCAMPAAAQDPIKAAPEYYKLVAENERVRVLAVTLPPGAKAAMHEHPDHLAVALAGGTVRMTLGDGKTVEAPLETDGANLQPAGTHATANPGTTPIEVIVIEMKDAPGNAALPTSRPGMKMTMLLQDPRVLAYKVAFEPSFVEPAGTTHDYDQVVIPLGSADTALTMEGKTTSTWKRGDVRLIGRGVPHATKVGTQSGEMIIVAIK